MQVPALFPGWGSIMQGWTRCIPWIIRLLLDEPLAIILENNIYIYLYIYSIHKYVYIYRKKIIICYEICSHATLPNVRNWNWIPLRRIEALILGENLGAAWLVLSFWCLMKLRARNWIYWYWIKLLVVVVVVVVRYQNGRKPVKLQKESPARCAGKGKQCKGN